MSDLAVVTGASGGIGAAVHQRLADGGDRVIGIDRRASDGVRAIDIRDADAVEDAVAAIERDAGPVTKLVNAAGVLSTGSFLTRPTSAWREMFEVNTFGLMNVLASVASRMAHRGRGAIVSVTSNAAKVPRIDMAGYAASKAAAEAVCHSVALELAADGVRCNTVAPGSTRTAMLADLWQQGGSEDQTVAGCLQSYKNGIPLRRVAEADDIARTVAFLLSSEARHITMQSLTVDGGASLGR